MTDLRQTISPKSDQLNADDLIGTTKTIRVSKVSLCAEPDQPIAINYEGDGGKPYKPCKSMRRVLVNVWGADGATFAGRSMTLYRDDGVKFGGMDVGGIRISHMSHIDKPVTMALTATRANRKPFTVRPLEQQAEQQKKKTWPELLAEIDAMFAAAGDREAVEIVKASDTVQRAMEHARNGNLQRLTEIITAATERTKNNEQETA